MFVIKTRDGRYYNGRAADWNGNLTSNIAEAFKYNTYDNAYRKAEQFNLFPAKGYGNTAGLYFLVEEV